LTYLHNQNSSAISDRIAKAQAYFINELESINKLIVLLNHLEFDNQEIESELKNLSLDLSIEKEIKHRLLKSVENKEFDVRNYIKLRNDLQAQRDKLPLKSIEAAPQGSAVKEEDIKNKELYNDLRHWRFSISKELNLPAYCILNQKALLNISNENPQSIEQLSKIKGVGAKTLEKYGNDILQIINQNTLND
jgi:superfamily II DNA helicase RecQ